MGRIVIDITSVEIVKLINIKIIRFLDKIHVVLIKKNATLDALIKSLSLHPVAALGKGTVERPPRTLDIKGRSRIKRNLYLLVNSLKAKKSLW